MTLETGHHLDIAASVYHGDPCHAPSLSASVAQILVEASPRHAWTAHPRLNPDYKPESTSATDKGDVAHAILLGRGKDIVVVEADDWRKKAAQEQREAARMLGKVAVLAKDYEAASAMAMIAAQEIREIEGCDRAFVPDQGVAEAVLVWQEPSGIWCRAMLDWLDGSGVVFDLKTGKSSANPILAGKRAADRGWDIKAAWYERGLKAIGIPFAGMKFVLQENYPPYALSVIELDGEIMSYGRRAVEKAISKWKECLDAGHWPAYPPYVHRATAPEWMMKQRMEREIYHEEQDERTREFTMRSQAPIEADR